MGVVYHTNLIQGTDEWLAARCGLLTASEMKYALSRKTDKKTGEVKYKTPDDDKSVAHLYDLLAQRITKYTEPQYISPDMLRGLDDELDAKQHYEKHYTKVKDIGFITNDKWGFTLGYSPDGLVGADGVIEIKGRRQKYQVETILSGKMPEEYLIQVQTGLLVSERKWCDFISYSGGMPMVVLRVEADLDLQQKIFEAADTFYGKMAEAEADYWIWLEKQGDKLINTERRVMEEIVC